MGEWKVWVLGLLVWAAVSLLCCSCLAWPVYAQEATLPPPPPPTVDLAPVVDAIGTLTARVDGAIIAVTSGSETVQAGMAEGFEGLVEEQGEWVLAEVTRAATLSAQLEEVSHGVYAQASVSFQQAVLLVVAVLLLVTVTVLMARR